MCIEILDLMHANYNDATEIMAIGCDETVKTTGQRDVLIPLMEKKIEKQL